MPRRPTIGSARTNIRIKSLTKPHADRLTHAKALRRQGEDGANAARLILVALAEECPDNTDILIETAFVHDGLGRESEAVPYYQRAIGLGLEHRTDRADVYLGLGSTYRTLGRYNDACATLEDAQKLFPDYNPIAVFLAMTYYNLGNPRQAIQILLKVISTSYNDQNLKSYSNAIEFYSDKIDQIWS